MYDHAFVWVAPGQSLPPDEPTPQTPGSRAYVVGEPQGQCLAGWDDDLLRTTAWEIASMLPGMHASRMNKSGLLSDDTGYCALIAPGEDHQMQMDMMKMSGCGLVGRGYLRLLGVWSPRLAPGYKIGAAFDDIYHLANANNAVRNRCPIDAKGDLLVIGRGLATHLAILMEVRDGWAYTVDGGQVDNQGRQCILWRKRKVRTGPGPGGAECILGLEARDVNWCVDVTKLHASLRFDWRKPWRFASTPLPMTM